MVPRKDAFGTWWDWAEKPLDSHLSISAELHRAVMELPEDDRNERAKVNEAARRAGIELDAESP
ncbi:MAG: hypothetical protein JOY90_21195 [Bradyrhizobium sp.]|uniref:hypothetical protein n=1 Tax=Bradyrhizobium sp. TaxID=376 RepID=UPI001E0EFF4A|nr:hypothetical protein [Bradyrhizobium sp.]MBV9562931.1 hypothetical protein [Bradyrhizobium sp.]